MDFRTIELMLKKKASKNHENQVLARALELEKDAQIPLLIIFLDIFFSVLTFSFLTVGSIWMFAFILFVGMDMRGQPVVPAWWLWFPGMALAMFGFFFLGIAMVIENVKIRAKKRSARKKAEEEIKAPVVSLEDLSTVVVTSILLEIADMEAKTIGNGTRVAQSALELEEQLQEVMKTRQQLHLRLQKNENPILREAYRRILVVEDRTSTAKIRLDEFRSKVRAIAEEYRERASVIRRKFADQKLLETVDRLDECMSPIEDRAQRAMEGAVDSLFRELICVKQDVDRRFATSQKQPPKILPALAADLTLDDQGREKLDDPARQLAALEACVEGFGEKYLS